LFVFFFVFFHVRHVHHNTVYVNFLQLVHEIYSKFQTTANMDVKQSKL